MVHYLALRIGLRASRTTLMTRTMPFGEGTGDGTTLEDPLAFRTMPWSEQRWVQIH